MSKAGDEISRGLAEETALMNAAADSYRKHFGDSAVEAAEKDVLGMALEALKNLYAMILVNKLAPETISYMREAHAVLALVGEGENR